MKHSTLLSSPNSGNTIVGSIPNRSLKFRAFDDGKMIYEKDINHLSMEDNLVLRLAKFWSNVRNDSHIMQFSGFVDTNGVEIYEGDIMQRDSHWAGEKIGEELATVFFKKGQFMLLWNKDKVETYLGNLLKGFFIIGNVFENPELLG